MRAELPGSRPRTALGRQSRAGIERASPAQAAVPARRGETAASPRSDAVPGLRRQGGRGPRVAIVGAGLMGRWHAVAANRSGARVIAVVDLESERARRLARCTSEARPLTDLHALAGLGIEVVHVCTPVRSHRTLAAEAIRLGLHALVEKPLTSSAAEASALYAAAESAGVLLCPVHQLPFQAGVDRAVEALDGLGAARQICFTACSAGGADRSPAQLDEVVAEILPHPLSLLVRFWPTVALEAEAWRIEHPRAGELLLSGRHGTAVLSAFVSLTARPTRFEFVVRCERGTVHLDLFHGYAVVETGRVSRLRKIAQPFVLSSRVFGTAALNLFRRTVRLEPAYPGLQRLVARFYDAVRCGTPLPVTSTDAIQIARARDRLIGGLGSAPTPRAVRVAAEP